VYRPEHLDEDAFRVDEVLRGMTKVARGANLSSDSMQGSWLTGTSPHNFTLEQGRASCRPDPSTMSSVMISLMKVKTRAARDRNVIDSCLFAVVVILIYKTTLEQRDDEARRDN
jgi:hypothetical protein